MIQLKPDCLIFQTGDGAQIPCSAEWVTLELMGDGAAWVDREIIQHVAAAVLHYFKHELNREYVSVADFALALDKVLRSFGLSVYADAETVVAPVSQRAVAESNLQELASAAGKGFELMFFPNLREEVRSKMGQSPRVLRFHGLRGCVKQLSGAERWSGRCQHLHDQIVEYVRTCWQTERPHASCSLVVL